MKILVTGVSGRIGRAIHARLSGEHEVVGLDRAPSPAARLLGERGSVEVIGAREPLKC